MVSEELNKFFENATRGLEITSFQLLFNIHINDLFYLTDMTHVCNYADDTTFYACDLDIKSLITRLEHDAALAIEWFEPNI